MATMTFALERPAHFLSEKSTKSYEQYNLGVPQFHNAFVVKHTFRSRIYFGLEGIGA